MIMMTVVRGGDDVTLRTIRPCVMVDTTAPHAGHASDVSLPMCQAQSRRHAVQMWHPHGLKRVVPGDGRPPSAVV